MLREAFRTLLPIHRHITFNLAGADVHDLNLNVLAGDAGTEVVADSSEVIRFHCGFVVVDAALHKNMNQLSV